MATISDYAKTEWVNDTTPAIDAEHLNKAEEGIYDNRVAINELLTDIDATKADIEQNTADIATNTANIATKAPSVSPTLKFAIKASTDGNTNPHVELRETGSTPTKGMGIAIYNEDGTLKSINDLVTSAGNRNFATVSEVNAKAPLASPALTGTPTAPTASVGTNTTQIATTAYVQSNLGGWLIYAPSAFSTSQTLAQICASMENNSMFIVGTNSASDFGGMPSGSGLLRITKYTLARCLLEFDRIAASLATNEQYFAHYISSSGKVSAWSKVATA